MHEFQISIRSPGDTDGDGYDDVVVIAPGALRVYRGGPDGIRADRWSALPWPRGYQPAHDRLYQIPRR